MTRTTPPALFLLLSVFALLVGCSTELTTAMQQDVQSQLLQRRSAYAACYTAALKRNETLKGQMTLTMVVGVDGQFDDVAAEGLDDVQLKQCVVDAISGIGVYKSPPLPIEVTYSLNFDPGDLGDLGDTRDLGDSG